MGGLGTSSGTSSTNSPWAAPLGGFGRFATKAAEPLISTLGSQYLEALRTGGVNSFIPWITRAVDASRQAGSQTMQDLRSNLSKGGLAGSSFAAGQMAQTEGQVNQQTAMTPTDLIMSFLQGAPGFALGAGGLGARALQGAGGLQNSSKTTQTPSFWDQFMSGANTGANVGTAGALAYGPMGFNLGASGGGADSLETAAF